jgi:hypothetical protein
MKRLMDLVVAVLVVMAVVFTVRSFRQEASPEPDPSPPPAPTAPPGPTPQEVARAQQREQHEELARRNQAAAEWKARLEAEEAELRAERERLDQEMFQNERRRGELPASRGNEPRSQWDNGSGGSSTTDAKRMEGRRQLAQLFSSIRSDAQAFVWELDTHLRACGDQRGGNCNDSLRRVGAKAIVVGRKLQAAHEIARTSWIPPGEVRELREQAGMDDVFWDRLVTAVNQYGR